MWTEWLTTIGWIYLGVIIGVIFGILVSSLLGASRFGDLEAENQHSCSKHMWE